MKSRLVKLSLVFSAVAFMAIVMFPSQSHAEVMSPNDVDVNAACDIAALDAVDKVYFIWEHFIAEVPQEDDRIFN